MGAEDLPDRFVNVPIDSLEAAAKRLHDMGYKKVGLWGISKGAELSLLAGSLLPGLVNAVISVAPMSTVCQGFAKEWSRQEQIEYTTGYIQKNFVDKGMCADWSISDTRSCITTRSTS